MSEDSGVVAIPLENVLMLVGELKGDESIAASLLRYHFGISEELSDWATTPVPELCEYYTACRQLSKIIMSLLTSPIPENVDPDEADGNLVLGPVQYSTLTGLLNAMNEIKDNLRWSHNISFEVH
jgi:hypothetical protein